MEALKAYSWNDLTWLVSLEKLSYLSSQAEFQKFLQCFFARVKAVCMENFDSLASKLREEFVVKDGTTKRLSVGSSMLVEGSAFFNVQKMNVYLIYS